MKYTFRDHERRANRTLAGWSLLALVVVFLWGSPALAQRTTVANGMSPLDVLLVKDAIRQKWAEYTLLIDGDGVENRRAKWAELSFSKDLRWLWFDPDGNVQRNLTSMEQMRQRTHVNPAILQGPNKHLPLSIKFDDITPNLVRTRTVVLFMGVPKAKAKGEPDGVPGLNVPAVPQVGMAVYHDTWRKEDGKWMKSVSTLYSAQKGFWPSEPTP